MASYSWITYVQARQALAARLADSNNVFWTDVENGFYLAEALRTWNALTEQWNVEFAFTASLPQVWFNAGQMAGSPRIRTVTDDYLYKVLQYHLLEPPTGAGVWTGTSQFALADLTQALQRRRDEMIQMSGCNVTQLPPLPSTPNVRRVFFNDSTLEPRRTRFLPDSTTGDSPVTLLREDTMAFDSFEASHVQTFGQLPSAWSVITGPPLAMDVDLAPVDAGVYDVLALVSGPVFAPPAATLVGVPDDWSWLAKWGALADLLSRDSEATDRERADYCLQRYAQGLEIMKQSNWLLAATIGGVPVDTPPVIEMDGFQAEWQDNVNAWPSLVTCGFDFCAPCPTASSPVGVTVNLVGNIPIPVLDNDFVQVSRDMFDVILGYAQVLASFKMGGVEFKSTADLEKDFIAMAQVTNKRLANLGIFRDLLGAEGRRQDKGQPR